MSIRTGTFVAVMALMGVLAAGCSQRYILRMSNPEQATTVSLFDTGTDSGTEDDAIVVLDEHARIARAARFFETRTDQWKPLSGTPPTPRYTISFRKGEEITDRFWIASDSLGLTTPSGQYFTCDLSDKDRTELFKIFRFTTNFKSFE